MRYQTARAYVASYVIIRRDGKIAFVMRQNTPWMNGYYSLAAGKVEVGESATRAAVREAKEEMGITVLEKHLRPVLVLFGEEADEPGEPWTDIFFEATHWEGEPHNAEPKSHSSFDWLDENSLPANIIPKQLLALNQLKLGKHFVEYGFN